MLSHREIIQRSALLNHKNVLVFEDDIKFYLEHKDTFNTSMFDIQDKLWDLFYL